MMDPDEREDGESEPGEWFPQPWSWDRFGDDDPIGESE